MKPLRNFEEFIRDGIVIKKNPNLPRAKSLVVEAEKRKRFLIEIHEKVKISNENANYVLIFI